MTGPTPGTAIKHRQSGSCCTTRKRTWCKLSYPSKIDRRTSSIGTIVGTNNATKLAQPIEFIRPPPHHSHTLLPEFGGMCISATDIVRFLMRKLTFDRICMPFAAFVQER